MFLGLCRSLRPKKCSQYAEGVSIDAEESLKCRISGPSQKYTNGNLPQFLQLSYCGKLFSIASLVNMYNKPDLSKPELLSFRRAQRFIIVPILSFLGKAYAKHVASSMKLRFNEFFIT